MSQNTKDIIQQLKWDIHFILPELLLSLLFILVIVIGLIYKKKQKVILLIIVLTGFVLLGILNYNQLEVKNTHVFFDSLYLSGRSIYFKFVFLISGVLTVLFSVLSKQDKESDNHLEYYATIIAVILGAHILVMSGNLVMAFLSFELISIGSYILAAFVFNRKTSEAAVKYIIFGMFSSGVMLYGFSFLYGITGSLDFISNEFGQRLLLAHPFSISITFILILAGVLFKISAFPFHIWAPDIYEAIPLPIAAFFSTASKASGIGFLLNLIPIFYLYPLSEYLNGTSVSLLIALISLFTICIGNFAALFQKNVKRMLGYSTIAQSGFIILPLVSDALFAIESSLFYLLVYLMMSFAAFFLVNKVSEQINSDLMDDYKGLGFNNIAWGILILIVMVSLTGLPPTGGFIAKVFIFSSLFEEYTRHPKPIYLVLFGLGILNTVVALFYYLKIPYLMFINKSASPSILKINLQEYLLGGALCLALFIAFFYSGSLMQILHKLLTL